MFRLFRWFAAAIFALGVISVSASPSPSDSAATNSSLPETVVATPVDSPSLPVTSPSHAPVPSFSPEQHVSSPSPQAGNQLGDTYKNVDNNDVQRPIYSDEAPAGTTARCRDGTYSFSQNRRGTCSHHGGVAEWL